MKKVIFKAIMVVALCSCSSSDTDDLIDTTAVQICKDYTKSTYDALILVAATDEEKAELEVEYTAALLA